MSLQEVTQEAHEDHRPRLLEAFRGRRVAVLTGAGTSTSAGLSDFQELSASWPFPEPREVMLSLYYWQEEPKKFWQAFRYAFPPTKVLSPTPFHRSLARLESVAQEVRVFTQNVDGLHQKAGSTRVTELHGNLKEAWDLEVFKASGGREGRFPLEAFAQEEVPRSPLTGHLLKPSPVLFGEGLFGLGEAREAFTSWADLVLVVGTSLEVGPVNELPLYALWSPRPPSLWWVNQALPPEGYSFHRKFITAADVFAQELLPEK